MTSVAETVATPSCPGAADTAFLVSDFFRFTKPPATDIAIIRPASAENPAAVAPHTVAANALTHELILL